MQRPHSQPPDIPGEFRDIPPAERALLVQLMRQTFGAKAELAAYHIVNRHPDYIVLVARLLRPAIWVTVKLAGPRAPLACPFDRTAALLRKVRAETSVPVPEVLGVDVSYEKWPWRFMIKRY